MKFKLLIAVVFTLLAVACSTSVEPAVKQATPEPAEAAPAVAQSQPDELALIKGPLSPDGLQVIFGTPDLGVGENRIGFVLTSAKGLVKSPAVSVSSLFFADEGAEGEHQQTALAVFRLWPYGTRGMYTTSLTFDKPGRWGLNINVLDTTGAGGQAQLFFEVNEATSAPAEGQPAIASKSKTINDVDGIEDLTTGSMHDPDLYQTSIADALVSGLPSVVVMASPAFCTNAVCGPQVEVLQQLKDKYKGQANFIHVDYYDNPTEIQGDLDRAIVSPTVKEWALPSTEWSFVIDRNGIITARFESFATLEELEQALQKIL